MQIDAAGACVICGRSAAVGDLAPELMRLPESVRRPIHASCYRTYVEESRVRGEAWARSRRGRWTLFWLRAKFGAIMLAAGAFTVVAAGPMVIALAVRAWRIRQAIRATLLGEARAVVIVGCRAQSDAMAEAEELFSALWCERVHVVARMVDIGTPFAETDLARRAWEHWGNDPKLPGQASVVIIPDHGAVKRFRITSSSKVSVRQASGRPADVRGAIERMLS